MKITQLLIEVRNSTKLRILSLLLVITSFSTIGCTPTQRGATVGTLTGAGVGALAAGSGRRAEGAIIGGVVGGIAGAAVGSGRR